MATPSELLAASAAATTSVVDTDGKRLQLRRMTALDRLRLFKAAGPILAQNQPWLGMAVLASSVVAIDEVPVPAPATEAQVEAIVARLGDAGIAAVAETLDPEPTTSPALIEQAGN